MLETELTGESANHERHGLDLTEALRILLHAGRPDPLQACAEPSAQLQALIDALCDLSLHDGLTGLVHARFFRATLAAELDRNSRTGRPCGLLLLDVDHFKAVNDTYGHQTGDLVLQQLGGQLRSSLRSMDTPGRIGGEEFAVVLPECEAMDAISAGHRIHALLNPLVVETGTTRLSITTSAGLVWTEPHSILTAEQLMARADTQLYRAKKLGRSRLCHPALVVTRLSSEERAALPLVRHKEESHGR